MVKRISDIDCTGCKDEGHMCAVVMRNQLAGTRINRHQSGLCEHSFCRLINGHGGKHRYCIRLDPFLPVESIACEEFATDYELRVLLMRESR